MGTDITYIAVLDAMKDRLVAMVDTYNNLLFEEVEWGRRGSLDMLSSAAYILPHPQSDVPAPRGREMQKSWRQWSYQIFIVYMGQDELETFKKIVYLTYSVYDMFMEKVEPVGGYGYNRTLAGLVRDLEVDVMNIVGIEDRGFKQISLINVYVELRV